MKVNEEYQEFNFISFREHDTPTNVQISLRRRDTHLQCGKFYFISTRTVVSPQDCDTRNQGGEQCHAEDYYLNYSLSRRYKGLKLMG